MFEDPSSEGEMQAPEKGEKYKIRLDYEMGPFKTSKQTTELQL